jgi:hypothetical protein
VIAVREGNLEHRFDDAWIVSKFDEWPFYLSHFQSQCADNKAVDVTARHPNGTLWFIELKDYRVHRRTKSIELALEVAVKVRDSLACIVAAAKWHSDHAHRDEARDHLEATKLRVVLHVEQPPHHSKLFPRVYDLANLQLKLKQLVKAVDAHPVVMDLAEVRVPWNVVAVA